MSVQPSNQPEVLRSLDPVQLTIESRSRDLGGLDVRRVLPSAARRMVGPFIFFDHMGPASFAPGRGIDVRPHPHIGLATVTYLFDGELIHRDSLGCVQAIQPGAVNLMTAGRGIVHSERSGPDREVDSKLHGIQTWMALPAELEDMPPDFVHYSVERLPSIDVDGAALRVIAGSAYGATSPVTAYSPTLYLELRLPAGRELSLPADYEERAVYVVSGRVEIGGRSYGEGVLVVAAPGAAVRLRAPSGAAHAMMIGGAPLGRRHIWWNFVASTQARIEQAKDDWANDRFDKVPGDAEFIPLP
jgi:redox-sensitive bicupin YhaK (pirin superfamily)